MKPKSLNQSEIDEIRKHVLIGLAGNRDPGFHFGGYFLQLAWPHIGKDTIEESMAAGPHCCDADGNVNTVVLGVMVDSALATASRLAIPRGARQATVQLSAQFTGHPARGDLTMTSKLVGFTAQPAVRQSLTSGTLFAAGNPVCHAQATFMLVPPPAGVTLAPLPWQSGGGLKPRPLALSELDAGERAVLRACDAALVKADGKHAFIEHFWKALPKNTNYGARCTVKNGLHLSNRVGHVQGGILFGLAAATARAATPRHPVLSGISAWFISPGRGKSLKIRSKVLHAGRSFAVVHTEIRTADGTRVLETVSNHAALQP